MSSSSSASFVSASVAFLSRSPALNICESVGCRRAVARGASSNFEHETPKPRIIVAAARNSRIVAMAASAISSASFVADFIGRVRVKTSHAPCPCGCFADGAVGDGPPQLERRLRRHNLQFCIRCDTSRANCRTKSIATSSSAHRTPHDICAPTVFLRGRAAPGVSSTPPRAHQSLRRFRPQRLDEVFPSRATRVFTRDDPERR